MIIGSVQLSVPLYQEPSQLIAHRCHFAHQGFYLAEFSFSHCADLTAWRASCIADFQDARQIVETKAHGERAANHPDAANSMLWVLAITIRRAARPEQPLAFIMAQSI